MPSATAREFQRVAQTLGFTKTRQTGSHERWIHPDNRSVTIPIHGGREIGPRLFLKIVRQLGVTLEEFRRLCRGL
jgi:predicted RNA binding protein YcfA (HicA-like mRNA interferase family)